VTKWGDQFIASTSEGYRADAVPGSSIPWRHSLS